MERLLFGLLSAFVLASTATAATTRPVKVFILAGQSNMEGQAVVDLEGPDYNGGRGTLVSLLADPAKVSRFRHLRSADGRWTVRDDVWVRYRREEGPLLRGPLGNGFSVYGDPHHFGPELQFGHVVGDLLAAPVLLVKTAWGGKSLYQDFLPPSSGGTVGPYYKKMITEIQEALAALPTEFPGIAGAGHELVGFVWYQGWNDGVDPVHAVPAYETNLVNLIRDVRRDLGAPTLPFVIGELTGPWVDAPPEWTALRRAQAAAATRPDFVGNVVFVPTHDFVRRAEDSPNPGHGHHEFGNAETCLLVGDALGKGMAKLLDAGPWRHQTRDVEGWTIHLSGRLLTDQPAGVEAMMPLLRKQLAEIVRVVPAPAVARLREVPLWFSPEHPGEGGRAEYHPGADWLREHGRDPAMAKGVEVSDVRDFAKEMDRMPNFMLHELAHGYHDRVLGFGHPGILAAYAEAKTSKRYDRVRRRLGNGRPDTHERAYAMTDEKEHFAEQTEAFFSRNDFFPFDRAELKRHDPAMARLLAKLWGVAE